jgi:4-amino-4-deoxy-L-arabinose transferase-like glycosyltransferase
MTLEEHLDFAGGLDRLVRGIVSVASVLLIPATWLLARRLFTPGWSLFAAALCSLSLLNLQFGQLARPHAFAAPFTVLAVAAAVRLRRRPDLGSYVLCGVAGALAIGALQSGVAVLLPFAVAFLLRERPADGAPRPWL